ncbi:MAG: translation initiation factor IF-2 [marine benthic group bacterium]|nr:translation initiation factor IF-2 [Gemmatimonadota bacterium]MCL7962826.1 translation initiation factor IF-2 [Candidatus Carthagonibacter metallireducens]
MGNYRVYEVAEELGVDSKQLIQMLHQMDVRVRSHMSSVTEVQIARLRARLERDRRGAAEEADGAQTTTRRRRRRRAAPEPVEAEAVEAEDDVGPEESAVEEEADSGEEVTVAPAAHAEEAEEAEELAAEADVDVEVEAQEVAPVEDRSDEVEKEPAPEVDESLTELAAEVDSDTGAEGEEEVAAPEVEEVVEDVTPIVEIEESKPTKRTVKPKPVRRGMPKAAPKAPAASAAPGGTVRIQAEGYTTDGRRKSKRDRKRSRRVDRDAVQENVKKTLATMEGGTSRRRRRESGPSQQEVEREQREQEIEREKTTVRVNEFLTVAELADLIDVTAQAIITSAFKNLGLMVTINQRLDFDQIELICDEFGFSAAREEAYEADLPELQEESEDISEQVERAPVVTVMGHVDHGKTSLLDLIRRTNVIAGESGGITQHIGAYHVVLDDGRAISFLDTPGHEAFTAMRARGAEITDLVVLVVAADDAVMPQTIEAISHARNAGVPLIVAINKVDLPAANVQKVKQDLLGQNVVLEEFGGDVLASEVSAKTGQGVDDLLDKVLLQSELLDLKAKPTGDARGTVVEAELDKGMGPVATVLVESGELNVGDDFICGMFGGRVRALLDERGNPVEQAGPSIPVRVLGIEGVPQAGDKLVEMDAARVREVVQRRQQLEREKDIRRRQRGTKLEDIFEAVREGGQATLNLIIKGDTDGSVQALADSLERLGTSEVAVEVIHRGVGAINESDVLLATTTAALIIGFHVRPDVKARLTAERDDVEIRLYSVIYEAVEEVKLALEGLLAPEQKEVIVGTAEVRETFRVPKVGTVAGCFVSEGEIHRNLPVRLLRDYVQIYSGKIGSLKRFKDDVREVREGYECGIGIEGFNDVKVGDVIECYRVEEVARSLAQSAAGN